MILQSLKKIDRAFLEEKLMPVEANNEQRGAHPNASENFFSKLGAPVLTLGEPQWYNIGEVYEKESKSIPAIMKQQLDHAAFFLVQFACSIRLEEKSKIEKARFSVSLESTSKETVEAPIAFDLYPKDVYEEVKNKTNIKIAPSLKFGEIEASLGEAAIEIDYKELIPVITSAGKFEKNFSWDLRETRQHPIRGVKTFYSIIKKPLEVNGVKANFDFSARIYNQSSIPFFFKMAKSEMANHSIVICS